MFQLSTQVQFLIVFVHTIQIQFQPSCGFPKQIGILLSLNAGIFTYMFSAFYVHSYNRKPRGGGAAATKEIVANENCSNGSSNNNNNAKERVALTTLNAATNADTKPTKKSN